MKHIYTKSQLMRHHRCAKAALLDGNNNNNKTLTAAQINGNLFQEAYRDLFSNTIFIGHSASPAPVKATQKAINSNRDAVILEACFQTNRTTIYADALHYNNGWHLTEIKSATKIDDDILLDVAIQAHTIEGSGLPLTSIRVAYCNKHFLYGEEASSLFIIEDVTKIVRDLYPRVIELISLADNVKQTAKRCVAGKQCKKPYPCEYLDICRFEKAEYPVHALPYDRGTVHELVSNRIYDIRDIPEDFKLSASHERVARIVKTGYKEHLAGAKAVLEALPYPHAYIDFETVQFAVPIFEDSRPYEQIPFQWSVHTAHDNSNKLKHAEFLDISGNDPRRDFAVSLIDACRNSKTVIVYNAGFERRILKQLASLYDDLSADLNRIIDLLFDLLPVVKKYYYHPEQHGSYSIKNVLPVLCPHKNYNDLDDVKNGQDAQVAYLECLLSDENKKKKRQPMLQYCKLDTIAMVDISNALCA